MDFLNQAIEQVSDLFRSMTPGARVTAGLAAGRRRDQRRLSVPIPAAGPDDFLFGGQYLTDDQLNQVKVAIAQAGLNDFERQGNRILVPRGQRANYLAAVADGGALPPNFHTYLNRARAGWAVGIRTRPPANG